MGVIEMNRAALLGAHDQAGVGVTSRAAVEHALSGLRQHDRMALAVPSRAEPLALGILIDSEATVVEYSRHKREVWADLISRRDWKTHFQICRSLQRHLKATGDDLCAAPIVESRSKKTDRWIS